jgi:hypothetical protein
VSTTEGEMRPPMEPIDKLSAEDFVCYLGRKLRPDGPGPEIVLDRIDRPEFPGWGQVARKPFSLIFRGPRRPVLREGLYPIAIADGPTLTLYIIPIFTAADDHQEYQAVFN